MNNFNILGTLTGRFKSGGIVQQDDHESLKQFIQRDLPGEVMVLGEVETGMPEYRPSLPERVLRARITADRESGWFSTRSLDRREGNLNEFFGAPCVGDMGEPALSAHYICEDTPEDGNRHGLKWRAREDNHLRRLIQKGCGVMQCAKLLGRTSVAVKGHADKVGLADDYWLRDKWAYISEATGETVRVAYYSEVNLES